MHPIRKIEIFNDKYPFLGPLLWILSFQYYVIQIIVSLDWPIKYSWLKNPISDLGNTVCSIYSDRYVCSPLHNLMNLAFIVLGLTMVLGSSFIYQEFKESKFSVFGFIFVSISGFGSILVGLYPENTIHFLHSFGAFLVFFIGNLGILTLSLTLRFERLFKIYSLISGSIGLISLILYIFHIYLGLNQGGMERIVAYPQTIWLIVFGIYMSRNRFLINK
ncbi:MAG TPA: DUF998 domain-containing protein [Patescibacteria group bacterium]|nr:DUF998 domain-containing protein [Patescibacteria group bacterium]